MYSEYKADRLSPTATRRYIVQRFVQNKLHKAGYEAKTRSGTRTPTLRRPTRRTSSSKAKGSKRGGEAARGRG